MKLLMITPYFYPEGGGLEKYAYMIARGLVERGWEVKVITASRKGNSLENLEGIEVIRLAPHFIVSNTPISFNLPLKLIKVFKEEQFSVINAHTPVPYYADVSAWVNNVLKGSNKTPFVLTYHNDLVKEGFPLDKVAYLYNLSLQRGLLLLSDTIITPSPYCYYESKLLRRFKKKLIWIPPGVDTERYFPGKSYRLHSIYNLPRSAKIVMFIGTMNRGHAHKGVPYLLKAFKYVATQVKDSYLVLVGRGDMIPEYKKMCMSLGISKRVIFTGYVEEDILPEFYRSSDVIVLPSTTVQEGFGMVLIEAGASGKPVIGTNVGGIKHVIENGKTGILVPPKDPFRLAEAIVTLLTDDNLARKIGKTGRRLVEREYSWDKIVEKTEIALKAIVNH
ncbi:glycosyltransferase family 4 protein [Pyrococcus abyssi]|uniref:Hexosyltransferase, glycosyltransferase family 1 n=1 Tax=Pyrococcus abyssi (strain GE5 / Orsay) TaxID=272844 RepID=Q9UYP6_PYRAB|nr:glycosyltransferase family 4 protein [Pyrococcus abyssi]CAB50366.1 Putative hexosyltransferase, glycosyltransferase family 1 [Pyrococcus abyssi GE5]CCE70910.1 TPA: LPS biosynthesis rfbu related protein [Pyrococcus abyssi GE5]